MTGPRVQGTYEYEDGEMHITTESGQSVDLGGESADRFAENVGAEEGEGTFDVPEGEWDNMGRSSFRR